jgi:nucleotide-binding universal stress UspA family protein
MAEHNSRPSDEGSPAALDTLTVLVTVDGSEKDRRALAVAAALIELADANACVLGVIEPPIAPMARTASMLEGIDVAREVRDETVRSTREAAARLGALARRDVALQVLEGTDVAAMVLDDLQEHHADFVVMATRAAGPVSRAMLGSVADRLVRESPSPVVLVPPGANYLAGKAMTLRRVLVPLDGSATALRVIPRLLALPHANQLELVLLQVVQPESTGGYLMPPGTPEPSSEFPDDGKAHVQAAVAERRLDRIADRLRAHGSNAEVRVVESRDPAPAIIDAVRNEFVELIAMSTRGESGLRRLVLGSVAEQVVRHSEVPVLLVTARSKATSS